MPFDFNRARKMIDLLETDSITKALMIRSFSHRLQGNNIYFFNEPFTPISLTGKRCSLSCKHCNSHYLGHMIDGSAGSLYSHAANLANAGEKGILLSGGSAPDGRKVKWLSIWTISPPAGARASSASTTPMPRASGNSRIRARGGICGGCCPPCRCPSGSEHRRARPRDARVGPGCVHSDATCSHPDATRDQSRP